MKKTRLEMVSEQLLGCDYKREQPKRKTASIIIKKFIEKAVKNKEESKQDNYYCLSHDYHISELKLLEQEINQK